MRFESRVAQMLLNYQSDLQRVIGRRIHGKFQAATEVDDLISEAYLVLSQKRPDEIPPEPARQKAFVIKVGMNLWIDKYRSLTAQRRDVGLNVELVGVDLADSVSGPSGYLRQGDTQRVLNEVISKELTANQVEMIELVFIEGMKISEAADALKIKYTTAAKRHDRALDKLRAALPEFESLINLIPS